MIEVEWFDGDEFDAELAARISAMRILAEDLAAETATSPTLVDPPAAAS